jgi:hypothetical protein
MITSYSKFCELKEGTLFAFYGESNSLYYVQSKSQGTVGVVVYVQEFSGCLPPKAITIGLWNQNNIRVEKVYTVEEMNKLEATLLTLTGLLNE